MNHPEEQVLESRRTFGEWAKRAGLFLFFGTMLIIPRIRRLRRRMWAWTFVRLGAATCATWLGWRYTNAGAGKATLALALLLFAFSLLVRVKTEEKSVDALACELNALIVLNGGLVQPSPDSTTLQQAQIFVQTGQFIVVGPRDRHLLVIPFAQVRSLAAQPVSNGAGAGCESWEVELNWEDDEPRSTTFHYDGAFAEHLARVTESTLRSQWKKELPVIQQ